MDEAAVQRLKYKAHPVLPPLLQQGPYIQTSDYLPYQDQVIQGSGSYISPLIYRWYTLDPPIWWDNLRPLLFPALGGGAAIGSWTGASRRAARFTAENAHRKPNTVKGWWYYKRTKSLGVVSGSFRGAREYSIRLASLIIAFSLLDTALTQAIAKAKTWRDEDRRARSLVRNYDGLGNYIDPPGPDGKPVGRTRKDSDGWETKLWPDEDGFELWDWVGAVGGGAAAGGILLVSMGLYHHWYPPTLLRPTLLASTAGGTYGAINMYDARRRLQLREDNAESTRVRLHFEMEDELTWRRDEAGRAENAKKREERTQQKIRSRWESGDYLGWGLAKLGAK